MDPRDPIPKLAKDLMGGLSSNTRADVGRGARATRLIRNLRFEPPPIRQVPASRVLDERTPHPGREPVPDQQVPEAIGTLVEIAHGEISENGIAVLRPP